MPCGIWQVKKSKSALPWSHLWTGGTFLLDLEGTYIFFTELFIISPRLLAVGIQGGVLLVFNLNGSELKVVKRLPPLSKCLCCGDVKGTTHTSARARAIQCYGSMLCCLFCENILWMLRARSKCKHRSYNVGRCSFFFLPIVFAHTHNKMDVNLLAGNEQHPARDARSVQGGNGLGSVLCDAWSPGHGHFQLPFFVSFFFFVLNSYVDLMRTPLLIFFLLLLDWSRTEGWCFISRW